MNIIRLTETDLHNIIKETVNRIMLNENALDRRVNKLIADYYQTDDFSIIRKKRANFLNIFPNARARNSKWLYRVLQWFYNDEIPYDEQGLLNRFLGYLHKNDYPDEAINNSDWSNLSFKNIKNAYMTLYSNNGNNWNNSSDVKQVQTINNYIIKRYDTQDDLRRDRDNYNYEWCIINDLFDEICYDNTCYIVKNKKTYNNTRFITVEEIIQMLRQCGKNDWADNLQMNIKEIDPDDLKYQSISDLTTWDFINSYMDFAEDNPKLKLPPYDDFGLSAFVVLVGEDGSLEACYSRYNMQDMCDGNFFDEEQICQLLGINNFNEVFPYVEKDIEE